MTEDDIKLEMAFTRIEVSCRNPHVDDDGLIRLCRRDYYHDGKHASDYPYLEWESAPLP